MTSIYWFFPSSPSDAATLPLVFAPESGNMLGGTIVNITGPCFESTDRVSCRFDTEEVMGIFVDRNRVVCVQPFMLAQGYVRFEISVGTEKYKWKGRYFVGECELWNINEINRCKNLWRELSITFPCNHFLVNITQSFILVLHNKDGNIRHCQRMHQRTIRSRTWKDNRINIIELFY